MHVKAKEAHSRSVLVNTSNHKLTRIIVMIAKPHSSSAVHHHGSVFLPTTLSINFPPSSLPPTDSLHREQDTVIYAKSGHGTVISNDGKTRQDLSPGDFALIPAWAEHQEVNDGDEEVEWIITRSGGSPVVVNLEGWGGKTKD